MSSEIGGNNARQRFQIRPFRSYVQMDQQSAVGIWSSLASAIDEIHGRNASTLSFEELYRNAYNLVLHKHGLLLYQGVEQQLVHHLTQGADRLAGDVTRDRLLEELACAWNEHRITMVMVRDIFMYMDRTYVPQNRKRPVYELGLELFRRVVWERPIADGSGGGDAAAAGGNGEVKLGEVASDLILHEIHQDRCDALADAPQRVALLRNLLGMLLELGHADGSQVYERDFEEAFLGGSCEFYRVESTSRLGGGEKDDSTDSGGTNEGGKPPARYSAMEYVHCAQTRIEQERQRAASLDLPHATRTALLRIVETELIERHAKTLVDMEGSGFASLLKVVASAPPVAAGVARAPIVSTAGNASSEQGAASANVDRDRIADLKTTYDLFSRVPSSVSHLRDALSERIRTDGRSLVRDQETASSPPAAFVRGVLDLRERMSAVVEISMRNEKKAQKRMREAFEFFLNADARAANCLTVYVDELLRVGLRGADEQVVSRELDRVIVLFRYLSDKDVFEAYYKDHLARRLLGNKSGSDEAERAMVSKLKAECGFQFTSKLEGMFNDMRISKETAEKYKSHKKGLAARAAVGANNAGSPRDADNGGKPVDVEVSVLTTGYWPSQNVPPCILPKSVKAAMDRFVDYYRNTYTGRKLSWQTCTGTAEIRATFPPAKSKGTGGPLRRHELSVSTYQMCILVLFNSKDVLTLAQIRSETNIPEDELRRHLVSLCTSKHRLLRKGSKIKGISGDTDTFTYNGDYTCKMKRVKVPLVTMRDATSGPPGAPGKRSAAEEALLGGLVDGSSNVPVSVEEDRRHLLEASIVRIMKARKVLSHNDLVAEVTRQLSARFVPHPVLIKKRVESLIEREYLERDESDRKKYRYVA